ncbi:MAG: hypothetical protein DWQ40_06740 [Actinobacteria bacterium]|nr:MAG: hypothetical protein DWQ40_06740 [Actinomycetota bacterium]
MQTEVPSVNGVARPPVKDAVSAGGTSVRATARVRPYVPVELMPTDDPFPASHPYVRRFWVAALGSGAIAELLRLVRAAEKGEEVRLPRHLPQLLRADLVSITSAGIRVSNRIPAVPRELRWRFPPSLAGEHVRWLRDLPSSARREPT